MARTSTGRPWRATPLRSATAQDNDEQFRVVVSNSVGSATSSAARLQWTRRRQSSRRQRIRQSRRGQTATFSVTASGTAPLSYQWQKNGADINGAYLGELHHSGHSRAGQWCGVQGSGEQLGRQGNQQSGDAYSVPARMLADVAGFAIPDTLWSPNHKLVQITCNTRNK